MLYNDLNHHLWIKLKLRIRFTIFVIAATLRTHYGGSVILFLRVFNVLYLDITYRYYLLVEKLYLLTIEIILLSKYYYYVERAVMVLLLGLFDGTLTWSEGYTLIQPFRPGQNTGKSGGLRIKRRTKKSRA